MPARLKAPFKPCWVLAAGILILDYTMLDVPTNTVDTVLQSNRAVLDLALMRLDVTMPHAGALKRFFEDGHKGLLPTFAWHELKYGRLL